ncbi:XrtA/PEP-CTERM system exopolysaccharide export protein [Sessilibacter corallicola]|uniref:Sugar ABC transporter substrate-binding protein n=1 Tax=Sessilibacter corallicola TaxID=2904075 RepID=A0ABQ0AAY4_9GAMM|nr:XrtA/PEP-CTERM system exopolysaccharide export protein [Sessilibacter corallicola]MCE2028156.1 polysaccharide biosynthesis/export family protein [Sessilibacter corallicola]
MPTQPLTSSLPKIRSSFRIVGLFILLVVGLAGCSNKSKKPELPITQSPDVLAEYHIGIGDQLAISVWRNQDLSVSVPVRPDGKISVPLAGDLIASGKTPKALAQDITTELTNFLKNPQVTVIVSDPSSVDFQRRVRVTGAVQSPISIPYRDGMTVLDLVLLANGLNDFAAPGKAKLYRRTEQGVKTFPVNLDDLLFKGKLESNYALQPSDVLSVPERLF